MTNQAGVTDSPEAIARDIAAVASISAVPSILRVICNDTGMGFATVARVTDETWTACAVQDNVGFGLEPGSQLDLRTTLCFESRAARAPIIIDNFSNDPAYRDHHTARIYKIESYISVPIILSDGRYFGNLCAIDSQPATVSDQRTLKMFEVFAELIAMQLESESRQHAVQARLMDEQATSELREQFIAVLGHDLRNPLSAVSATGELLCMRKKDPDLVKLGQRLGDTVKRMARLIDDVMDFARGRLGSGLGVSVDPNHGLALLLRQVVHELRTANTDRVIAEEISIERAVHCDGARLQQLLSNLLGNAVTHGAPEFPITVKAVTEADTLVLSVHNRGGVIGPDSIKKVFEPYWRPTSSKPGGGLGLGLFICREIVRAHGGALTVRSSDTEGTVFVACIPCEPRGVARQ